MKKLFKKLESLTWMLDEDAAGGPRLACFRSESSKRLFSISDGTKVLKLHRRVGGDLLFMSKEVQEWASSFYVIKRRELEQIALEAELIKECQND